MSKEEGRRLYPPPVGWIPFTVGLIALIIVTVIAFVPPQAGARPTGAPQANDNTGTTGTGTGDTGGATPDGTTGGTKGRTVTTGGTTATLGGPNGAAGTLRCAAGKNGGKTDTGVTDGEIHVASTIVTEGAGGDFLKEAPDGIQAALDEANNTGGICGRRVTIETINDGWDRQQGQTDISHYINQGNVFALLAEPDSEGLSAAIDSKIIDRAGIPVVGTDGMLSDQYTDPWVWPVAASTVTNMHIAAKYAVDHYKHADGSPPTVGIVYDTKYKFGKEGANAFDAEYKRLTGKSIQGDDQAQGCAGTTAFCGIQAGVGSYNNEITAFNKACASSASNVPAKCDVVVMLLEPSPMEAWMGADSQSNCQCNWYGHLMGGEPLFDDNLGQHCGGACANMMVWTGYHPAIQPFDSEKAVYTYSQSLKARCPSCDPHNEFTEGAYLGTRLFLEACRRVGEAGLPLTRANLRMALNSYTYDLGLSAVPLHFTEKLPHLANTSMAGFSDNAPPPNGSFNGWNYLVTGFLPDPASGQDLGNG
jgi:ABC-type branched-subunit amino acid transport system substrate-binding protein